MFSLSSQAGDCNILICDETGDSLSPAVLACILLVRYQVRLVLLSTFIEQRTATCNFLLCFISIISILPIHQMRVKDVIATVESIRPSSRLSLSMTRGLDQLQKSVDDKVLSRLGEKLRKCALLLRERQLSL